MKKYVQLNFEEHVTIKIMLQQDYSIQHIAKHLDRSPSTISREIKRGITVGGTYFAESTELYMLHNSGAKNLKKG